MTAAPEQPATEAGRALLNAMRFQYPDERAEEWRKEILAIEREASDGAEWETFTDGDGNLGLREAASPSVDWGRLGYVLSLIGPVDTEDTEDAFVAYTEDIRARYEQADLENDPQYASYVARLHPADDAP